MKIYIRFVDGGLGIRKWSREAFGEGELFESVPSVLQADAVYMAKLLDRFRDTILSINDHIEDEGDRVYFGSTNHADTLREIARDLSDEHWDRILDRKKDRDLYAEMRELRADRDRLRAESEARFARIEEIREEGCFLLHRLAELEFCDLEQTANDFEGHCRPSIERLRGLVDREERG